MVAESKFHTYNPPNSTYLTESTVLGNPDVRSIVLGILWPRVNTQGSSLASNISAATEQDPARDEWCRFSPLLR
jgi:hypothetical protein